ncbi:hypothetical protein PanWU01x14_237860 [Parasponia andersonii]|uniref:Uncharacterized protein n=1 Tax=Parasponia andersonii TaxID=3476 RepID=A0A2P5BHW2_PARAD|nr:hypothetical protein PanWU01x14_237860 [Parasponia andersonii]
MNLFQLKQTHIPKYNLTKTIQKIKNLKPEKPLKTQKQAMKAKKSEHILEAYQGMKQDQDKKSNERIKATIVESWSIISQNDSVIGHTHHPKNQKDHDRAQTPKSCAELEHIPSHRNSRSMHTSQNQLYIYIYTHTHTQSQKLKEP